MVLSIYDAPRRFQLGPLPSGDVYYSVDIDMFPEIQKFLAGVSSTNTNLSNQMKQEAAQIVRVINSLLPKNPQGWKALGYESELDFGTLTDGTQLRLFPGSAEESSAAIKMMADTSVILNMLKHSSDQNIYKELWNQLTDIDYTVAFPSVESSADFAGEKGNVAVNPYIPPKQSGTVDDPLGGSSGTVAQASGLGGDVGDQDGGGVSPTGVVTKPLTMRIPYMAVSGDTSSPASTSINLTQKEYDFLVALPEMNSLAKTINSSTQFIELQMGTFWRLRRLLKQSEQHADLYGSEDLGITNEIVNKINNGVLSQNPWNPYDGTMPPVNDEMSKSGIQWALNTTSGKWELVDFDLGQGVSPAAWRWISTDNQDPWNPNAGSWKKDTSQMYDQIGRAIGDTIPSMYMPFLTAVLNNGGDLTILLDENGVPYNLGVYAWVQYALMQAHLATQPDAVSMKQPTAISYNPGEPPTTNMFDALPNLAKTIGQARDIKGDLIFHPPSDIAGTRSDIPGSGIENMSSRTGTADIEVPLSNMTSTAPTGPVGTQPASGFQESDAGPSATTAMEGAKADIATQAVQAAQAAQDEQDALANDAAIAASSNGTLTTPQVTAARHNSEQNQKRIQKQQGEEDKAAVAADGEWVPFGKYYEMNNQKVVRIKDAASLEAMAKDIAANNPSYTDKGKLYEAQYGLGSAADSALTFAKAGLAEGLGEGEMERLGTWQFVQAINQARNLNAAAEKQNKMNAIENKTFADAQAGTRNTSKDSTIGYNIAQNVSGAYGMTPEEYYDTFLSDNAKGISTLVGHESFDPTDVSKYGQEGPALQQYATAKDDWEDYAVKSGVATVGTDGKLSYPQGGVSTADAWAKYIEDKNKKNAAPPAAATTN